MSPQPSYKKVAQTLMFLIILMLIGSIIALIFQYLSRSSADNYVASIYQDGILIQRIPLDQNSSSYSFDITKSNSYNSYSNTIEIRSDSIGITAANCPDKLCVKQGFIHNSLLPITCLPNHLVIQIEKESSISPEAPDVYTY